MSIGVTAAAPVVLAPIFLQPKAEREKPWHQRYWVKANAWIAIFGFVGNYLWTHYFYQVLGAAYTFKAHELNQVWWKGMRNDRWIILLGAGDPSCVIIKAWSRFQAAVVRLPSPTVEKTQLVLCPSSKNSPSAPTRCPSPSTS